MEKTCNTITMDKDEVKIILDFAERRLQEDAEEFSNLFCSSPNYQDIKESSIEIVKSDYVEFYDLIDRLKVLISNC